MKDIHKLGLRGRLPTFIESFLADRAMQKRVGSTLSYLYDQEQGSHRAVYCLQLSLILKSMISLNAYII